MLQLRFDKHAILHISSSNKTKVSGDKTTHETFNFSGRQPMSFDATVILNT